MLLPPLAPDRARRLVASFAGVPVLVVGDAMLDRFIVGRVTRISPEAPVPVVAHDHDAVRVGGAANVAHNVSALGGRVTLVAVTGADEAADILAAGCRDAGVVPALVRDSSRRTTTKVRIVTDRHQQVARIDYESDADIESSVEEQVLAAIRSHAADAAAIVVSDYMKGGVTAAVMRTVVDAAAQRGVPVLVDPKIAHVERYAGATLVTPNHHEAESATGMRVRTHDDAREAARRFQARAGCRGVIMTRGDQGVWVLDDDVEGSLPATAREVADVTGAGDTVIAALALALAAGATTAEAARMANEAAGIAVGRFGPAVVGPAELLAALGAAATSY